MRVGTSAVNAWLNDTTQDHPHACGDKYAVRVSVYKSWGSSPCVWGQDKIFDNGVTADGIIPMRVGTRT